MTQDAEVDNAQVLTADSAGHGAQPWQQTVEQPGTTAEPQDETRIPEPHCASTHEASSASQPQPVGTCTEDAIAPPMSKNALKRLRRQEEWEQGRDDRRIRRREKRQNRKQRLREERKTALANGADPATVFPPKTDSTAVPVAILIDCDFEMYMTEKERVSLASQVTRCYSDNRNARYRSHLWIAGWHGKIRHRFENALCNQHRHWKGVGFAPGNFLACAAEAREQMRGPAGGLMVESLQRSLDDDACAAWTRDPSDPVHATEPEPELDEAFKDVVYLTSESPYTLQRLEPHTCYVVGGLVDRNREKGLCYRRASERGIRTARLPIGQFMVMQSRQVLATNHVVEIMLKWLQCGDWAQAFMAVIPKRKGGKLIGDESRDQDEAEVEQAAEHEPPQDDSPCGEGQGPCQVLAPPPHAEEPTGER